MSSSNSARQSKPPSRKLSVLGRVSFTVGLPLGIWGGVFIPETPNNTGGTVILIITWLIWSAGLIQFTFQQLSKAESPPGQVLAQVLASVSAVEGIFAQVYELLSAIRPQAFNSPLTGIDAAYFTISTATTTGMGDIQPVSGAARLLVTAQMVSSLALVVAALGIALNRFYGQATPPRKSEGAS